MITYDDFEKVDIRVGKVIKVEEFPEAINPSYILTIDFGGEIGVKKSSGQFKGAYPNMTVIEGRLVIGVVNFPPKKIGPFESEVLTLGLSDGKGSWVLVSPDQNVEIGERLK